MRTFTDTELQKKFCEGFTFFPFKSLEQHDTLIYKRYAGTADVRKLLEWHSREHGAGHYLIKLTKKLKNTDIPAAANVFQLLQEAEAWADQHLVVTARRPVKQCRTLFASYQQVLKAVNKRLNDRYEGTEVENLTDMQNKIRDFLDEADELQASLEAMSGNREPTSRRMPGDSGREHLSRVTASIAAFRAHQERNLDLFDAWRNHLMIQENYRALN